MPPGRYALAIDINTEVVGAPSKTSSTLLLRQVTLTDNTTVAVDARQAVPIAPSLPDQTQTADLSFYATAGTSTAGISVSGNGSFYRQVYAFPTSWSGPGSLTARTSTAQVAPILTVTDGTRQVPVSVIFQQPSRRFAGQVRAELVDVGHATPADLARASVRGNIALLQPDVTNVKDRPGDVAAQLRALRAAGAVLALLRTPTSGQWWIASSAADLAPVAQLDADTGDALAAELTREPVTLEAVGTPVSPFAYFTDTGFLDHIPAAPPTLTQRQFATVDARYHQADNDHGVRGACQQPVVEPRPGHWRYEGLGRRQCTPMTFPYQRGEYLQVASGLDWVHEAVAGAASSRHDEGVVRPDQQLTEDMFASPERPCAHYIDNGDGSQPAGVYFTVRPGGAPTLTGLIDAVCGADPSYSYRFSAGTGLKSTAHFYIDGQPADVPSPNDYPVPAGQHTYRIVRSANRSALGFATATTVTTDWTFTAAPDPAGGRWQPLPVAQLNWSVPLSISNTAQADEPLSITLRPMHQLGTTGPEFKTVTVEMSTDHGSTWRPVRVERDDDGKYQAEVPAPENAAGSYVSLRGSATDQAGNAVTETIIDAYQLHR